LYQSLAHLALSSDEDLVKIGPNLSSFVSLEVVVGQGFLEQESSRVSDPYDASGTLTANSSSQESRTRAAAKLSLESGEITLLARGASDESDTAVALPLTAVSSQNVIGSFEARFFLRGANLSGGTGEWGFSVSSIPHSAAPRAFRVGVPTGCQLYAKN
jgi:hypothetical protein